MSDRPSIRQGLDYIIQALDVVVESSLDPNYCDEVAAEEMRLRQIVSRAELALSFIKAQSPVRRERAN